MKAGVGATAVAILGQAMFRAVDALGLTEAELSAVLAADLPRLQALRRGLDGLQPQAVEWQQALLLIELYQALLVVLGNEHAARHWLNSHNRGLQGRPRELILQSAGLVRVIDYLRVARAPQS